MNHTHILIIRFSAIGDIAMTVPVVNALALQYPDVKVTVLSRPFAKAFFSGLAPNVFFMGADLKDEYKGISGLNELFKRVYSKNITHVADFHDVLRSKYLSFRFLINGKKVAHINKHRHQRRRLCRIKDKVLSPLPSSFDNYADVLARLGFRINLSLDNQSLSPLYNPLEGGNKKVFALGNLEGALGIGIAPGASYKGKIYPQEKMAELIALLQQRFAGCRIYIFGEKDNPYSGTVNVRDICNGFAEEIQLMESLKVMISMDSANMHIASLVGLPVVSVWGQTHPLAGFMGWGQSTDNAVQLDLPCRPCSIYGNKECRYGDYRCITQITPQAIADKVERIVRG